MHLLEQKKKNYAASVAKVFFGCHIVHSSRLVAGMPSQHAGNSSMQDTHVSDREQTVHLINCFNEIFRSFFHIV